MRFGAFEAGGLWRPLEAAGGPWKPLPVERPGKPHMQGATSTDPNIYYGLQYIQGWVSRFGYT